jgi:hypothetical protein
MKYKFPRTYHLPWSLGATDDDKTHTLADIEKMFGGKEVVITEKMDGENTTIYANGMSHARSLDSGHHPSRSYVKNKAAEIKGQMSENWRVVGENLYARHSIAYSALPDFFVMFGIVNEKNIALSWNDVEEWGQLLDIPVAPVLYRGIWDAELTKKLYPFNSKLGTTVAEGYVVRIAASFSMDEFSSHVAKFVRANHVTTSEHWSHLAVIPNKLSDN